MWKKWLLRDLVDVIGGLTGGFLVTQVFPGEVSLVTVFIGAFVGSQVFGKVSDIVVNKSGYEVQ